MFADDVERCLRETGADAVMSAEGVLYNPALFRGLAEPSSSISSQEPSLDLEYTNPRHADLALEYLSIVRSLKTRTSVSAVKGHLFKLMRPALGREKDLREQLGKVMVGKAWYSYVFPNFPSRSIRKNLKKDLTSMSSYVKR